VAYRADIEIAVRGATRITNLQQQINTLAKGVNVLNKTLRSGTVASIDNFNKAVSRSDRVMRAAAQGTRVQKQAIDTYVRSTIAAEKAEKSLQVAIQRRRKELGLAAATPTGGGTRGGTGGRLGGAISGAVIGGSFPLLFGQGGGAAAGGAIGGLAGGLLGPGGSFAGSLLGTLIGDIASKGKQIKELGTDIGFSAEQTKELQSAFKLAGQEAEKFNDAVQNIRGLSLSIEEQANAIRLVSQLTETYGGRIDKTTSAFTSALESGKVTQATLNQLTSQGIPIQDELAKKYGVSRDAILAMAKDGQVSVQTLADVLVDMGNKGIQAGEKPKTAFEQFTIALGNTVTAVTNVANALLTVLAPAIDAIIQKATLALNALTETINTELLRTQIQGQTGKVISPETMQRIEKDAMGMAARRYPSEAKGRQLAAGSGVISPRAQQEFQILREQGIRNELQRFGYEQGILKAPKSAVSGEIGRITAPGQLPPSGGGGGGKSARDRAAEEAAKEAERVQEVIRNRLAESQILRLNSEIQDRIAEAEAVGDKMLVTRLQGSQRELDIQYRYAQELAKEVNLEAQKAIIYEGQTALVANQRAVQRELNKLELDRLKTLEEIVVGIAEETALVMAASPELRQKLELEQKIAKWKKDGVIKSEEEADAIRAANTELEKQKKIREQINAQQQMLNDLYDGIANQIAGGVGSAIDAVASGVDNLGDSLKDIGRDILAAVGKMLIFYALAQALGALGGNDGVGFFSILAKGFGFKAAKDGGYWPGGFSAFADGGVVTKPTMGLVGEGGEPEYIIPASKMSAAMKRYGGGARGSAVIPSSGDTSDASGNATTVNGAIDVRYTVERINSVDYVTADQFQQGMQQAAMQGAQRGEQMVLRKLQQSPTTRRRVGVS